MGAHRTEQCERCDFTTSGPKRDTDHAMGVHLATEHPQSMRPAPTEEVIEKVIEYAKSDATQGHLCPSAAAITPLEDGWCPWCGRRPKAAYEWYEPTGLRPFWRPIVSAA